MVGGPSGATPGTVYFFIFTFMIRSFQYIGDSHTMVQLQPGAEKVKVGFGEIVESDRDPKYFTNNRFQDVTDGVPDNEEEKSDGPLYTELADLSVAQLKDVAENNKIDLGKLKKKDEIVAFLTGALEPEKIAEVIEAANKEAAEDVE